MSELEEKFYNWLMLNYCVPIKPEKIAKDLAEIAKKEMIKADDYIKLAEMGNKQLKQLQKENTALKEQFKRQKELYLDLRNLDNKNLQEIEELKQQIEEGVIIFEGTITLGDDNGLTKYAGKKGKIIFIEDKEE